MLLLRNNALVVNNFDIDEKDFVVRIPYVGSKKDLLVKLKEQLSFPYFGYNWDALDEVLCDLEWIINKRIVLFHEKTPSLSEDDLKIYLDILQNAVSVHRERGVQELIVAFPEEDKDVLSKYYEIV